MENRVEFVEYSVNRDVGKWMVFHNFPALGKICIHLTVCFFCLYRTQGKELTHMAQKHNENEIPSAVLHRLPRYYRCLRQLIGNDVLRVRSSELAQMLGASASQIRQDLHYFGEFGQQGYGYNVKDLYSRIGEILGINRNYAVVIWGEDGSGIAVSHLPFMSQRGIGVRAVFDSSPAIALSCAYPLLPEEELRAYCSQNAVDIVILCTGRAKTPHCAQVLRELGVRGVWNLTGIPLVLPGITVHELCPADDFLALCCDMHTKQRNEEGNG